MRIDLSNPAHVLFFVMLLPALSFGAGWEFNTLFPNWPFWLEGVSPMLAYGLLYAAFERFAWHWPPFHWLGIVTVPDLRGRWVGGQLSSYKGANGKPVESRVVLEVGQTFSRVRASTYYYRWDTAHAASTFLDIDGELYLVLIFESEPGVNHAGGTANKGVGRLRYLPQEQLIVGTYFNTSGNHGELKLHRSGKRLLHRFTA